LTNSPTRSFSEEFLGVIESLDQFPRQLRILDVGTGTARIPVAICRQRGGIELTAVDRSGGILQRARQHVARAGLADAIRIDVADARQLPYAAWSFDAVISNGLVHHLSDRMAVLREMTRVLRPGGLLFVRDSLPGPDGETIAGILARNTRRTPLPPACAGRSPGALTIDEARALVSFAGFPGKWVRQSGPRHWLLEGRVGR
jgi:ubiquinone/menaquinone biosynthesis C-methylase UbiE